MTPILPPPATPPSLGQRVARFFWEGRAGILGASFWMFEASALTSLLLAWIPLVGPFLGPVFGGFTGGRRAGTPQRALGAALIPAILLTLLIFALGAAAAHMTQVPVVGALAAIVAGAVGVIVVLHNLLLFGAALAGGWMRQNEDRRFSER